MSRSLNNSLSQNHQLNNNFRIKTEHRRVNSIKKFPIHHKNNQSLDNKNI
jgi:hypothetical protein